MEKPHRMPLQAWRAQAALPANFNTTLPRTWVRIRIQASAPKRISKHLTDTDGEHEGLVAVTAGVKLVAVRQRAGVVHSHLLAL